MFLLQLILGTPNSVNLRNLVWHGFPGYNEIDSSFCPTLFVLIASFGRILAEKKFAVISKVRSTMDGFIELPLNCYVDDFENILKSELINDSYKDFWMWILNYYSTGDYEAGIVLLLPQMETLLRQIYGEVNQVPITAKLNKYYIIMDTIFYEYQIDDAFSPLLLGKTKLKELKINKMFEKFPIELLHVYYDIFICDGIKLRDKISHGEVDLKLSLNMRMFKVLLQMTSMTIAVFENEKISLIYESYFHPNSRFRRTFNETFKNHQEFQKHFPHTELKQFDDFDLAEINFYIKIFYRFNDESEIVKLLTNISEKLNQTIINFQNSLIERTQMLENRTLRSSRRKTLNKITETMPTICKSLEIQLKILLKVFQHLQNENSLKDKEKLTKNLKFMLKFAENLVVYARENNWFSANESSLKIVDYSERHKSFFENL